MSKTVENLQEQLKGIRRNSVSPGFIETFKVPYYEQMTPIKHIAEVSRNEAGITITPHDPNLVYFIAKFLQEKGMLNAYAFSKKTVVVSIPPANESEVERINTHIAKLGEDAKVAIRNIRKNARKGLTKEELQEIDKPLQKMTEEACAKIDMVISPS